MKHLWLDGDLALDRVGHKTIFFGLVEDARHAVEIVGGSDNDSGANDNLGHLISAALHFFEPSFSAR